MTRLKTPVGEGAANHRPDVKYVQYLLADWQLCTGRVPLVVDGICGPLTQAAIEEFQSSVTGVVDGRVDVNGPAIEALETMHLGYTLSSIRSLDYLAIRSQTSPPVYDVQLRPAADRYLTALRARFGS
jgi:hypothetical protein